MVAILARVPDVSPPPEAGQTSPDWGPLAALVLVCLVLALLHWVFIGRHRGRRPGGPGDGWH